jgi:phosphate uptake regulator
MDALFADDSEEAVELANRARDHIETVDDHVRDVDKEIHEYDPQFAQVLGLVADSLSRTADYGGNIAESALQKAAPSP